MFPVLIHFITQLLPKIIGSLERGCERSDLPFSHHLLHALQCFEVLLDTIHAANAISGIMNKIERFLVKPRIESIWLGRLNAPDQFPYWKALFASAGFSPVAISNLIEAQADCILKKKSSERISCGEVRGIVCSIYPAPGARVRFRLELHCNSMTKKIGTQSCTLLGN